VATFPLGSNKEYTTDGIKALPIVVADLPKLSKMVEIGRIREYIFKGVCHEISDIAFFPF
jgi:hypothetical protein